MYIMKKKLYVLLGDVISSRQIIDREKFQDKFEETLKKINVEYVDDIFADFKILKGIDEIGSVLSNISNVYKMMDEILEQLHPNLIRFVLIFDYIDAGMESLDISKMDGPAFHKASDTMNTLKKSKLMFEMCVGDNMIDAAIAGQINLILLTKKNWSLKQHQIVREYKSINNQDDVAIKLGITQQAVSKTLNKVMWKEMILIEKKLNYIIDNYSQNLHAKGGA